MRQYGDTEEEKKEYEVIDVLFVCTRKRRMVLSDDVFVMILNHALKSEIFVLSVCTY